MIKQILLKHLPLIIVSALLLVAILYIRVETLHNREIDQKAVQTTLQTNNKVIVDSIVKIINPALKVNEKVSENDSVKRYNAIYNYRHAKN